MTRKKLDKGEWDMISIRIGDTRLKIVYPKVMEKTIKAKLNQCPGLQLEMTMQPLACHACVAQDLT